MAPANENTPAQAGGNPYSAEIQERLVQDMTEGLQQTCRTMGMIASHASNLHPCDNILKALVSAVGRIHVAYLSTLPEHEARKLLEEHAMLVNHTFTKKAGQ